MSSYICGISFYKDIIIEMKSQIFLIEFIQVILTENLIWADRRNIVMIFYRQFIRSFSIHIDIKILNAIFIIIDEILICSLRIYVIIIYVPRPLWARYAYFPIIKTWNCKFQSHFLLLYVPYDKRWKFEFTILEIHPKCYRHSFPHPLTLVGGCLLIPNGSDGVGNLAMSCY